MSSKPKSPKSKAAVVPAVPAELQMTPRNLALAGFRMERAEGYTLAVLAQVAKACAKASEKEARELQNAARDHVITGYLVARCNPGITEADMTNAMIEAARTVASAAGVSAKDKPGLVKRTPEQEQAYEAARKRWGRAAQAAGITHIGKSGGKRDMTPKAEAKPETKAEAKPEPKPAATPVGKIASLSDMLVPAKDVHAALKALNNPAKEYGSEELYGLYVKALEHVNAFVMALAPKPKK